MSWERLGVDGNRHQRRGLDEVRGVTKFLLDNNVDADLLRTLDGRGISANLLPLSLVDRPDDEVLAEAWRQDRILLTHDADFLNEQLFPYESNPGLVVMPGGNGTIDRHLVTILDMLELIKPYRDLWRQTCVRIWDSGMILIKGVNATSGQRIEPWWLRFIDGVPHIWVPEESPAAS